MSLGERDGCVGTERERVEVVLDRLDLRVVVDLVAHAEEHVLDLALHLRDRVQLPERQLLARERDVDELLRSAPLELFVSRSRRGAPRPRPRAACGCRSGACRSRGRARRAAPARGRSSGRGSGRARRRARPPSRGRGRSPAGLGSYCCQSTSLILPRRSTGGPEAKPRLVRRIGRASVRPRRRAGAG